MKTNRLIHTTAALATTALLTQLQLPAQALDPWQTVDDLQVLGSFSYGIGTDSTGTNIFSVGYKSNDTGNTLGVVRFSNDSGQTWSTLDSFLPPGGTSATFHAFAAEPVTGSLYVGGGCVTAAGNAPWVVRRSGDGGRTWATEDLFQTGPGLNASCWALRADAAGNLYASGWAADRTNPQVWTMRRRDHLTGTWTTVDGLTNSSNSSGYARGLTVDPTAGVFVVGFVGSAWTVRRSLDGGSSWSTVDAFSDGVACAVAADGSGAIYVVGSKGGTWVVRRSTDGGTTWSTLDTYDGAISSLALAVTLDHSGVIWVAGWVSPSGDLTTGRHWLVRKGIPGPNGSVSWTTSDDFLELGSAAFGVTADRFGNVFTSGVAGNWIVRKTGSIAENFPSLVVQATSPGLIQVTWPATAAGFVLESTESLTAPSWSSVGDVPAVVGDQNVVGLGATNASRFFRLRQQ